MKKGKTFVFLIFILSFFLTIGCKGAIQKQQKVTITLAGDSSVEEVFKKEIIPSFQEYWLGRYEQPIEFRESYEGPEVQVRRIIEGFEADIVVLPSLEHLNTLKEKRFITYVRENYIHRGIIASSVIAFGVHDGNPRDVFSWESLARKDIKIIGVDSKNSGIARWVLKAINIAALYLNKEPPKTMSADQFLRNIRENTILSKSDSYAAYSFNRGTGDVFITTEQEIKFQQQRGRPIEMIIPSPTISLEYPIVLMDKNVDDHNNREVAEAFIKYLWTKKIQKSLAYYGFRPVDEGVMEEFRRKFSTPSQLVDISVLKK